VPLAIPLATAESKTFSYLAPAGWDTFDASSSKLRGIQQGLYDAQNAASGEFLAPGFAAVTMSDLTDHQFEGAAAIDSASKGVDGALVIVVRPDAVPASASDLASELEIANATNIDSHDYLNTIALGHAVTASGTFPTGHQVHRAYIVTTGIVSRQTYELVFVTKSLSLPDSRAIFEAVLKSITPTSPASAVPS
jgi:hypothetical protein